MSVYHRIGPILYSLGIMIIGIGFCLVPLEGGRFVGSAIVVAAGFCLMIVATGHFRDKL